MDADPSLKQTELEAGLLSGAPAWEDFEANFSLAIRIVDSPLAISKLLLGYVRFCIERERTEEVTEEFQGKGILNHPMAFGNLNYIRYMIASMREPEGTAAEPGVFDKQKADWLLIVDSLIQQPALAKKEKVDAVFASIKEEKYDGAEIMNYLEEVMNLIKDKDIVRTIILALIKSNTERWADMERHLNADLTQTFGKEGVDDVRDDPQYATLNFLINKIKRKLDGLEGVPDKVKTHIPRINLENWLCVAKEMMDNN